MRRTFFLFSGIALLSLSASAAELTGWISDSACGASNASSEVASRECAERCLKNGSSAVFVTEKDQKVYKIAGSAKVMEHLKGKVKVTGEVKGDTITISKIADAGA